MISDIKVKITPCCDVTMQCYCAIP